MGKIYVHQIWNYGLGNFINLTPTIKLMADHFGHPVPVYFDLDFIKQCFLDCDFIEILDKKPDSKPLFGSWLTNNRNDCADYINTYREVCKMIPLEGELPHTYVDQAKEIDAPKYNTVFIRGSGQEGKGYLATKMPDDKFYQEYFSKNRVGNYSEAFVGSESDVERSNGLFDMTTHTGGIRLALALIREADLVVANDSGLAHAAGAMNKNMVILWKNTSLPKNGNPGKRTMIKMCT